MKLYLFGCSPLISRVSWIYSHKSNFQKSLAVWAWLPSPSQQAYKTPELILFILEGRSKVVQKNAGREFPRQNYDGFKISLSSYCPCGICSFSASHAFPVLSWSESMIRLLDHSISSLTHCFIIGFVNPTIHTNLLVICATLSLLCFLGGNRF